LPQATTEAQRAQRRELRERLERELLEDEAADAVFEEGNVEVNQETKGIAGHFEVRNDLGFVNGGEVRYRL
jgi:predicted aspartyl protease